MSSKTPSGTPSSTDPHTSSIHMQSGKAIASESKTKDANEDKNDNEQSLTKNLEDEDLEDVDPVDRNNIKELAEDDNFSQPKSYASILTEQFIHARHTFKRSNGSVFTSALLAGLEIGMSYIMLMIVLALLLPLMPSGYATTFASLLYPIGFIIVVVGQSLLYTEQTSLLSLPVVVGIETVPKLARLWLVVIAGNLIGGCLFSYFVVGLGLKMSWFDTSHIRHMTHHVLDYAWWIILASGIMAGWLMGLAAWLATSARDTFSRIVLVGLITACIGVLGLHHSIVGNIEVFAGLVYADTSFYQYLEFLLLALLGNTIGGVVFVTVLKARALQYDIKKFREEDLDKFNTDWVQ